LTAKVGNGRVTPGRRQCNKGFTGYVALCRYEYTLGALGALMSSLDAWADPSYCWVVICKNSKAHHAANMMFGHKILLAETDAFEPPPVSGPFLVQCDECREEHSYQPAEVLRLEFELPNGFTAHPRFR